MFEQVIAAKVASDPTWVDTRRSRSYTFGSPEGVHAVIACLPPRYPMELIAHDMETVVRALSEASNAACPDDADHEANQGDCPDTCWRWSASGLLGSIATTVGVEWV